MDDTAREGSRLPRAVPHPYRPRPRSTGVSEQPPNGTHGGWLTSDVQPVAAADDSDLTARTLGVVAVALAAVAPALAAPSGRRTRV